MILKRRQRAWVGFWLLMFLLASAPGAAGAPNLTGVWQGSSPAINWSSCYNEQVTVNIIQQCGNLFRGKATVGLYTSDVVGSIKNGTVISIHNYTGASFFFLMGDYQDGLSPKINVSYLSSEDSYHRQYDAFQLSYAGKVKGNSPGIELLLLD